MLPISGTISFADLKNEFGDTDPVSLNEFYAGGPRVPIGASGISGSLPTVGKIALNQFYGISGSLLSGARWTMTSRAIAEDIEVYGGQAMYASGSLIHRSSDGGFTWTSATPTCTPNYIMGHPTYALDGQIDELRSAGSMLFASFSAGQYAGLFSSTDGENWVTSPTPMNTNQVSSYGGVSVGIKVCQGLVYNQIVYFMKWSNDAPDGVDIYHWSYDVNAWIRCKPLLGNSDTSQPQFFNEAPGKEVGSNGVFIIAGNVTNIYTSPDATTWVRRQCRTESNVVVTTPNQPDGNGVVFNNRFLAPLVGGKMLYSNTGIDFIVTNNSVLPTCAITSVPKIASCGTYLLAIYKDTSNRTVSATSTDGLSWTQLTTFQLASVECKQLLCVGSYWLISTGQALWHAPV